MREGEWRGWWWLFLRRAVCATSCGRSGEFDTKACCLPKDLAIPRTSIDRRNSLCCILFSCISDVDSYTWDTRRRSSRGHWRISPIDDYLGDLAVLTKEFWLPERMLFATEEGKKGGKREGREREGEIQNVPSARGFPFFFPSMIPFVESPHCHQQKRVHDAAAAAAALAQCVPLLTSSLANFGGRPMT